MEDFADNANITANDNANQISFPKITISAINCNTFNMATVAKHIRIRKFYGISSLKTDIIFVSDIRMCNKNGSMDMKFIRETFAINPHCSYSIVHQSTKNCRGVCILVKKTLDFTITGEERDEETDNYLIVRASINNETVILGSIYGPSKRDDNFFARLRASIARLGDYPIVLGGDWNTTYSHLNVQDNLDIKNMADVPNHAHSKLLRKICTDFKLVDPFRVLYPNRLDFSYAPWGNLRNNRSRIDFFLVSTSIIECVRNCVINPFCRGTDSRSAVTPKNL